MLALTGTAFLACCAAGATLPPKLTLFPEDAAVEPCHARAAASAAASAIRVEELRTRGVIGVLGHPLGVVAKMEATVVEGASLQDKEHRGSYLLQVDAVGGEGLAPPVLMEFRAGFGLGLATDIFQLAKMKTGKETGSLDDREISKLQEGYVGAHITVYGYEEGNFAGVPECMPRGSNWPQARGFRYTSGLVVLERLK
jgi:hypothetical protein